MLDEGKDTFYEQKNKFKETLKVKIENITKRGKVVETPICYGD